MSSHMQKLREAVRVPEESESEASDFESWEED
jgi:hypothetical protein